MSQLRLFEIRRSHKVTWLIRDSGHDDRTPPTFLCTTSTKPANFIFQLLQLPAASILLFGATTEQARFHIACRVLRPTRGPSFPSLLLLHFTLVLSAVQRLANLTNPVTPIYAS